MQQLCETEGVSACWLIDRGGKTIISSDPHDETDFSIRRFSQLRDGFSEGVSEPFTIKWESAPLRYCGAKIDDNRMFVIAQNPTKYEEIIENITSLSSNIQNIKIGSSGFVFSINAHTNTVETYPNNALVDADAFELGLTPDNLRDGFEGTVEINGINYFCVTNAQSADRYLLAVVPYSEMVATNTFMVVSSLILLLIAIILIIAYGIIIWNYSLNHPDFMDVRPSRWPKGFINRHILQKMLPMATVTFLIILVVSYYLQTLYFISNTAVNINYNKADISQTLADYDEKEKLLDDSYNERNLEKCKIGAYIVEQCPQLLTFDDLSDIAALLGVKNIYYFNVDGVSTVSSASQSTIKLSDDKEGQSYPFWAILSGTKDCYVQELTVDDTGTLNQYIASAVYNEKKIVQGMLEISVSSENRMLNLSLLDMNTSLSGIKIGNNGIVFAVDRETKQVTYHPDETLIGKSAYDLGMTDHELKDSFSDFVTFNGEKYFASSLETGNYIIYVAVPEHEIGITRMVIVGITLVVAAVIFALLIFILVFSKKNDMEEIKKAVVDKDKNSTYFNCIMPDGSISTLYSAESRFSLKSLKWREKTPEQKLATILNVIFSMIAIAICAVIWMRYSFFSYKGESMLDYIINGGWENNLNIFSLTNVIVMTMLVIEVAAILRKLFMLIARSSSQRAETIGRLMCAIIKYAALIICIFNGLRIFGVDTSTLMTSAGLLSLIIGLGAQSLISDLIAGLFIVFEGEFRVGDIVSIDGWRGTVIEIGLRTTKLEDPTHNVKIFNNSKIAGIVNMTQKYSMAFCDVGVEYGESIERVEAVLKRELPLLKDMIPGIEREPQYLGITNFGDSSVDIRIMAECPENIRGQVERLLRREIKLIFDRNNIGIPFPQVVVNQPESFESGSETDKKI